MKIRKAKLCDAGEIHSLMQPYIQQGLLLPRSLRHVCENIRDFTVIEDDGRIVASGALHFLDEDVAEIQSLSVHPARRKHGLGTKLTRALLREARGYQAWKAFALTHDPHFFHRLGFQTTDRSALPQKFVKDCSTCPRLMDCAQTAVIYDVFARRAARRQSEATTALAVMQPCSI